MTVLERQARAGVVPVVVLDRAEDAVPTARALIEGGIDVMEITLRTPAAAEAIHQVAVHCPQMLVGAGTVLNVQQAELAVRMGARFIVSPGFDRTLTQWCLDRQIPIVPGCVTPTEIMAAVNMGLQVLKFFPAGTYGGLSAMKNLAAPFAGVKFMPTGGVNAENLRTYLRAPMVHAVGGSWICPRAAIAAGEFEKITALCREARQAVLEGEAEA